MAGHLARPSPIPATPTHEILQLTAQAPAVIRVRNLQTTLPVGTDAWGRPNKSQPVLISTSVYLRQVFDSASTSDAVTGSTVHYGTLSKGILKSCKGFEGSEGGESVRGLVDGIQGALTQGEEALLTSEVVSVLVTRIMLPKASLLGSGVSLTQSCVYDDGKATARGMGVVLEIHDLRIPTLIGVNANERLAKQIVGCSVQIEGWVKVEDVYGELEQVIVKTIEESSFQTLESLASVLGEHIIRYFIIPHTSFKILQNYPGVRMSLEKPTAVTMADAPVVELVLSSDHVKNNSVEGMWGKGQGKKVPFPLQGSLREWIVANRD